MIPASSKDTLAVIARCVNEGGTSVHTALEAAYQLGRLEGGLEMAKIGQKAVEPLLLAVQP